MLHFVHARSLIASVSLYAGLGNRMRTILGAQSLAELEERQFAYCWPTGRRFGASLDELWKFEQRSVPLLVTRALALKYPFRKGDLDWLDDSARAERVWQIRTGQPLALPPDATPWTDRLQCLRPADGIAERVTDVFARHLDGRPYVGVMVRAHEVSHALTRQHSPVDWFTNRMHQIRAGDPNVGFFVSCDVPSVQDKIIAEFDGAVGLSDKGPYNSAKALRSAVVDLYLLASSTHLLGPHYSSFPELALHLAGDSLVLETSMTPESAAWGRRPVTLVTDPTNPSLRR